MRNMSDNFEPIPEQAETTAEDYIDPVGEGPGIPDPMPKDLQTSAEADRAFEAQDPMEGEAPSS